MHSSHRCREGDRYARERDRLTFDRLGARFGATTTRIVSLTPVPGAVRHYFETEELRPPVDAAEVLARCSRASQVSIFMAVERQQRPPIAARHAGALPRGLGGRGPAVSDGSQAMGRRASRLEP
jgi:hypothetical protein